MLLLRDRPERRRNKVVLLEGGCEEWLPQLKDSCIDMVATCPPYFWQKDYGVWGQIGLEPSLDVYIKRMRDLFREVRRVLHPAGTCWIQIGDTYANNVYGNKFDGKKVFTRGNKHITRLPPGFTQGTLMGVPWRLAIALQDDGWILRQEIVLNRHAGSPGVYSNRSRRSHEYLFMFTKNLKYTYNIEEAKKRKLFLSSVWKKPIVEGNEWLMPPEKSWHPCPSPLRLYHDIVAISCPQFGTVLDPFAGTGTTAVAAVNHGCNATLIELKRMYFDRMSKRICRDYRANVCNIYRNVRDDD